MKSAKTKAEVRERLDNILLYEFDDCTFTEVAKAIVKHQNKIESLVLALEYFQHINGDENREEFVQKFRNYLWSK